MDPSHIEAAPISDDSLEGYDIIGDIHGKLRKLVALLKRLGYRKHDGVWQHPHRKVIFIGDLIDRGRKQVAVVRLVQRMIAAGQAHIVMGNHECNAIAWVTTDPETDEPCRDHDKNREGHAKFLRQVGEGRGVAARVVPSPTTGTTRLKDNEAIDFDYDGPDFASNLLVDYVGADGSVSHYMPRKTNPVVASKKVPPGGKGRLFGKPTFTVGPPFGTDIVIFVASSSVSTWRSSTRTYSSYLPCAA